MSIPGFFFSLVLIWVQMLMMIKNFVKSLQLEESLVLLYLVVMHLRVIMHNIYNAVVLCAVLCCALVCCSVLCCAAVSKVNKSESCTMAGPVWGNEREGGEARWMGIRIFSADKRFAIGSLVVKRFWFTVAKMIILEILVPCCQKVLIHSCQEIWVWQRSKILLLDV